MMVTNQEFWQITKMEKEATFRLILQFKSEVDREDFIEQLKKEA